MILHTSKSLKDIFGIGIHTIHTHTYIYILTTTIVFLGIHLRCTISVLYFQIKSYEI